MFISEVQSDAAKAAGEPSAKSSAAELMSRTVRDISDHFTPSRILVSDGDERPDSEPAEVIIGHFPTRRLNGTN
jgi:hypothetical protein